MADQQDIVNNDSGRPHRSKRRRTNRKQGRIKLCSSIQPSDNTDLMIYTRHRSFAAHKAVLLPHSEQFATRLAHDFWGDEISTIHLEDVEDDVMYCALRFMYEGKYCVDARHLRRISQEGVEERYTNTARSKLELSTRIYMLAQQLLAPGLDGLAFQELRMLITNNTHPLDANELIDAARILFNVEDFWKLKQLFAYAITFSCSRGLWGRKDIEKCFSQVPSLGWEYVAMQTYSLTIIECRNCNMEESLRQMAFDYNTCMCLFRGLCSEDCGKYDLRDLECPHCAAAGQFELKEGYHDLPKIWADGELVSPETINQREKPDHDLCKEQLEALRGTRDKSDDIRL